MVPEEVRDRVYLDNNCKPSKIKVTQQRCFITLSY